MAKFKPANSKKAVPPPSPNRGLIPCGLLVVVGMGLVFGLMYLALDSAGPVSPTKSAPATAQPANSPPATPQQPAGTPPQPAK